MALEGKYDLNFNSSYRKNTFNYIPLIFNAK